MKLYITSEHLIVLKRNYLKKLEKNCEIINVGAIAVTLYCQDYKIDKFQRYILTDYIEKKLRKFHQSKKIKTIILIIDEFNVEFIEKLFNFLDEKDIYFIEKILIDYNNKVEPTFYKYFQKII